MLHDSVENKLGIEVYDSFEKVSMILPGKTYINKLLEACQYGKEIAYVVNKLTRRKWLGESYLEYMKKICNFTYTEQEIRELDTVAALVKQCDKFCNINPSELKIAKSLEDNINMSPLQILSFEKNILRAANSYLTKFDALFERFLLMDSRQVHGDRFLEWDIVKDLLRSTRERANKISTYDLDDLLETKENRMILGQLGTQALIRQHYAGRLARIDEVIKEEREKLQKRKKPLII